MKSHWTWFLLVNVVLVMLGCDDASEPLPPPKDEAARRAAQRDLIAADFKQIANFYKAYNAETKKPTSLGFWKYVDGRKDVWTISAYIKEQQYAIQIPVDKAGIIGFERDTDLDNTRVVVMADGTVNKTMPEAEFQKALKKGKR